MLRNHEDAENAAQDVFARLHRMQKEIVSPKSFLYRTATNMVLTKNKKRKKDAQKLYAEATNTSIDCLRKKEEGEIAELFKTNFHAENPGHDAQFEIIEARLLTDALFNEEDEKSRIVYCMKYYDGMTLKEIGEITGLSINAVNNRIIRLRNKIQQKINKDKK